MQGWSGPPREPVFPAAFAGSKPRLPSPAHGRPVVYAVCDPPETALLDIEVRELTVYAVAGKP